MTMRANIICLFRPSMPLARNTLLLATLDLAESLGLSRSRIYHEIELNESVAETPNAYVPSAAIIDAMEFAAWRTQRSDFGLVIADRRDHLNLGLLGLLVEQCASVAEVHEVSKRFLHSHNGAVDFDLTRERTRGVVRLSIDAQSEYQPRHYVEAVLAMYVRMLGLILGPRWRPGAVYFKHEQLGGRPGYDRRFGHGVKFRQKFNGVIFKLSEIDRKGSSANPRTKLKIENLILDLNASGASRDFTVEVARLARMLLPSRGANVEHIAELMRTSTRSLQRKLSARGTTFGEILAETRAEMARDYLSQDGLTVDKVAPLIGFSEPSAVSRFLSKRAKTSARALKRDAIPRQARPANR
jgi:AraC-like DNA-binding protein